MASAVCVGVAVLIPILRCGQFKGRIRRLGVHAERGRADTLRGSKSYLNPSADGVGLKGRA